MNAVNSSFIMLCSLLVLLMTPALAMFYSGMVKSKNTLNTIMNLYYINCIALKLNHSQNNNAYF